MGHADCQFVSQLSEVRCPPFIICCPQEVHHWLKVLRNVNATFPHGKMTLLVGSPGSGKTTLLKLLAGQLQTQGNWKVCSLADIASRSVAPAGFHICLQYHLGRE